MLAFGAIEGRTAALDDALHRAAAPAWLTLAVVHREALREIAELAVGADGVLEARPARLDRFGEHLLDRGNEALQALERHRPAGALWMDPSAVQRLADVDVAEPGDDALVAKQQLDRSGPSLQPLLQVPGLQLERLRAERLERRPVFQLFCRHEADRSEPPRIVEREARAVVGLEQQMIVLLEARMVDAPAP